MNPMDSIELTVSGGTRKIRISRAHVTQWWPADPDCALRTTCGDMVTVAEDYATVTQLMVYGQPPPDRIDDDAPDEWARLTGEEREAIFAAVRGPRTFDLGGGPRFCDLCGTRCDNGLDAIVQRWVPRYYLRIGSVQYHRDRPLCYECHTRWPEWHASAETGDGPIVKSTAISLGRFAEIIQEIHADLPQHASLDTLLDPRD